MIKKSSYLFKITALLLVVAIGAFYLLKAIHLKQHLSSENCCHLVGCCDLPDNETQERDSANGHCLVCEFCLVQVIETEPIRMDFIPVLQAVLPTVKLANNYCSIIIFANPRAPPFPIA